jgi:hypothetical protein
VGGTAVAVRGTAVAVGGTAVAVAVGGTEVAVAVAAAVAVGGALVAVAVGGTGVAVPVGALVAVADGGNGVAMAVGGAEVAVGGTAVAVRLGLPLPWSVRAAWTAAAGVLVGVGEPGRAEASPRDARSGSAFVAVLFDAAHTSSGEVDQAAQTGTKNMANTAALMVSTAGMIPAERKIARRFCSRVVGLPGIVGGSLRDRVCMTAPWAFAHAGRL